MSDSNLNTIDAVTIAALRQGVNIAARIADITVDDDTVSELGIGVVKRLAVFHDGLRLEPLGL